MKNKIGKALIGIGVFLILAAFILVLYNFYREYNAKKKVEKYLPKLEKIIKDHSGGNNNADNEKSSKTMNIDGMNFLGILSVPSKNLELPILADYSYELLDTAPCRYSGSYDSDDLVIGGHNYRSHFSKLKSIKNGEEIFFTSFNGTVYKYSVLRVEILEPTQIEDLINKQNTDDWDLTLFTCTSSGAARCVIRCKSE
ncbi:sortase [Bovifimicola ammoniilytica]|jgi:sortase A|uniref:sortase n=1 Tax=Bovifimicola ammoniilytica TaxID=2981720 RepID=UPI00082318DC|nr:sortase [Bovifimicola ammoniilytica]MCU6753246.1 sortase [Bovifimicola ammoniilytica]SCJ57889.1 Sortase (surface protein transpeptidase) [uncultured Eubacterium sp.]